MSDLFATYASIALSLYGIALLFAFALCQAAGKDKQSYWSEP